MAKAIAHVLPINMIGGFAVAQVRAIGLLLLVCFLAGQLARAASGKLSHNTQWRTAPPRGKGRRFRDYFGRL